MDAMIYSFCIALSAFILIRYFVCVPVSYMFVIFWFFADFGVPIYYT